MMLLIDNSNTRTKFMWATRDGLCAESLRIISTAELTPEKVDAVVAGHQFSVVVIASVVPWAAELLHRCFSVRSTVYMLDAETAGVGLQYDYPGKGTLGADRIANAIAAAACYPLPCIAVDAGTAITFDVIVQKENRPCFVGGAIAPGLKTMLASLRQGTALLPQVDLQTPRSPIGGCTQEAMLAGVYWGACGMADCILQQMEAALGQKTYVVATGGDAPLLASVVKRIHKVDAMLTFRGLWQLALAVH